MVDKGGEWSGGGEWGVGGHRGGEAGQAQEQSSLELGELEQLTISNDNDLNYDQVINTESIIFVLYKLRMNQLWLCLPF